MRANWRAVVSAMTLLAGVGAARTPDPPRHAHQSVRTCTTLVRMPTATPQHLPMSISRLDPTTFGVRLDPSRMGVRLDPNRMGVRLNRQLRSDAPMPSERPGPIAEPRSRPDDPGRGKARPPLGRIKGPVTRDTFGRVAGDLRRSGGCAGGACGSATGSTGSAALHEAAAGIDPRLEAPEAIPVNERAGLSPRALSALCASERDWAGAVSALAAHLEGEPEDFESARHLAVLLVLAGDAPGAAGVMHMAHAADPALAQHPIDLGDLGIDTSAAQDLTRAALRSAERERTPAAYLLAAVVSQARGNCMALRRFLDRGERAGLNAIVAASFAPGGDHPVAAADRADRR